MRFLAFALCLFAWIAGAARAATPDLLADRELTNWELVAASSTDLAASCRLRPDGVLAVAGLPVGFIATKATFENYRLHAEWRWPGKPGNSGILVHISSGPKDRAWPVCFQVQTKHQSAGDLLPMAGAAFAEPLTSLPAAAPALRAHSAADSEKPAGEWNTGEITCRGDRIEVVINGILQNRVSGCSLRAGKIGFQLEGVPFELRQISVVRLD